MRNLLSILLQILILPFQNIYINYLKKSIINNGVPVTGKILKRTITDDPHDAEHKIFEIEYSFTYLGMEIIDNINFSLNTTHVMYATQGALLGVPKLPFDYETFLSSLSENALISFLVHKKNPKKHLVQWNEIVNEVFQYNNVWA